MQPLKLAYYGSLAILVVIMGLTLRVLVSSTEHAVDPVRVQQGSVQDMPDQYVVSYELVNREPQRTEYQIAIAIGGITVHEAQVPVKPNSRLGYSYHVQPEQLGSGAVTLSLFKSGEDQRLDWVTYHFAQKDVQGSGAVAPGS